MPDQTWTPPREWEPQVGERVIRSREPAIVGVVVRCDCFGHFADWYWRADVRWIGGGTSCSIETSNLTREDGTQG